MCTLCDALQANFPLNNAESVSSQFKTKFLDNTSYMSFSVIRLQVYFRENMVFYSCLKPLG